MFGTKNIQPFKNYFCFKKTFWAGPMCHRPRGSMRVSGRAGVRGARPTTAPAQRQGNELRGRAEAVLALRRTQTATVTVGERRSQVRAGAAAVV